MKLTRRLMYQERKLVNFNIIYEGVFLFTTSKECGTMSWDCGYYSPDKDYKP